MAQRPIFIPELSGSRLIREVLVEFKWHSGLSKFQAQKSINSLHEAANNYNLYPILEISSRSENPLGVALSAFNLMLEVQLSNHRVSLSVECAYQGSKVFTNGGPYPDLYYASSRDAKIDQRLRNSGNFSKYIFFGEEFPHVPVTAFYDWIYITALSQQPNLADQLFNFQGFSDIVFNPAKSLNCQARAAALFVSLAQQEKLEKVLLDKEYYISLVSQKEVMKSQQQLMIDF